MTKKTPHRITSLYLNKKDDDALAFLAGMKNGSSGVIRNAVHFQQRVIEAGVKEIREAFSDEEIMSLVCKVVEQEAKEKSPRSLEDAAIRLGGKFKEQICELNDSTYLCWSESIMWLIRSKRENIIDNL